MENKNEIKRVDYLDFISGNEEKKNKFIKDFGDSFSNMGFAIVQNHGISVELKTNLYDAIKQFFALPMDQKKNYEEVSNSGQRGYISKNKEKAKGFKTPDLKEFFHIGQEELKNNEYEYPSNIWVKEVPELKQYGLKVFRSLEKTGKDLLEAIALYLNLPRDYFERKIKGGNSILRLLHYYPLDNSSIENADAVRAAAHGDINLITLLMGANAEGLQAQTLDGEWLDVMPEPNEIVINVGDMLARLTNDKLRSTIHRVVNPTDPEKMKVSRYSTPFFLHPIPEMDLTCLSSCIGPDNPKSYVDMTAGEFLKERLVELGLAVKQQN